MIAQMLARPIPTPIPAHFSSAQPPADVVRADAIQAKRRNLRAGVDFLSGSACGFRFLR
jgi:hypothetical protein